jgi:hypothetical protein
MTAGLPKLLAHAFGSFCPKVCDFEALSIYLSLEVEIEMEGGD